MLTGTRYSGRNNWLKVVLENHSGLKLRVIFFVSVPTQVPIFVARGVGRGLEGEGDKEEKGRGGKVRAMLLSSELFGKVIFQIFNVFSKLKERKSNLEQQRGFGETLYLLKKRKKKKK